MVSCLFGVSSLTVNLEPLMQYHSAWCSLHLMHSLCYIWGSKSTKTTTMFPKPALWALTNVSMQLPIFAQRKAPTIDLHLQLAVHMDHGFWLKQHTRCPPQMVETPPCSVGTQRECFFRGCKPHRAARLHTEGTSIHCKSVTYQVTFSEWVSEWVCLFIGLFWTEDIKDHFVYKDWN